MLQECPTPNRAARAVVNCAVALVAIAFARPAAAQAACTPTGMPGDITVCGFVWNDLNEDGSQDAGEPGLPGVEVVLFDSATFTSFSVFTDNDGYWNASADAGTYTISVLMSQPALGTGWSASPTDAANDTIDSDGIDNTFGTSVIVDVLIPADGTIPHFDFGFSTGTTGPKPQPGTGTPGYWKNHPDAWANTPYANSITVGGYPYTKAEAIAWLGKVGKDKRTTMFSSLVPAMLNVAIGNSDTCIASTIAAADAWMATYAGTGLQNPTAVPGGSTAWSVDGEPLHQQMDAYNNGLLCAPHRN